MQFYSNAHIYGADFSFHTGGFAVDGGKFVEVGPEHGGEDLHGAMVIPGLIDIHNHGNSGADLCDGTYEAVYTMGKYLAENGITSFAPASMTVDEETLSKAYDAARLFHAEMPEGTSALRGINMEGPFFSFKKKGGQNPAFLQDPDYGMFCRLNNIAGGLIRVCDVAPELPGALTFIRRVSEICTVSEAHTAATYEEACAGFDAGATHVTHLYNAMPSLLHRDPGVIGAASERENVTAELICDGKHVHPSAVRAAFRLFGAERICMISDALAACGVQEGECMLGGQQAFVYDGLAHLSDGTIAGAVTNVMQGLRNAVMCFGIRKEDAIRAATYNPAKAAGMLSEVGSIEVGKSADFVVLSEDFTPAGICVRGTKIK